MRLGVRHYVSKPFNPEILHATVRVALREAGARLDHGDEHRNMLGVPTQFRSVTPGHNPP